MQYHEVQDSGWWEWRNPRQCGNAIDTIWWPTLQQIHLQSAPVTDSIAGVCCASGKFCCFCEMDLFKRCGQASQQIWHLVFLRWLSRSGLQLDASFHLKVDAGWTQCRKCIGIFSNTLGQILPDCPTSAKLRIHRAALQIYCSTGEGIIESENIIPQFKKSGYVNTMVIITYIEKNSNRLAGYLEGAVLWFSHSFINPFTGQWANQIG